MRRFCPSTTDLLAFEATARHGSFTRAAEQLCVTQGAVSKQIKSLETFLGVSLFVRGRHGLTLTDAGRGYLNKIGPGLRQIEAASLALIARQELGGTLHLTAMPTFGARWLIPRLPAFKQRRPDIHVEFLPHQQGYDFSWPELDAAIRFGSGDWPGSFSDYIVGREVLPVCHPRLAEQCARPQDLLRHPLLHHTSALQAWPEWFREAGIDTPRSREGACFDQYSLLTHAAIAGLGIALIPSCLVEEEMRDGKLATALRLPILSSRGYYLCYPEYKAGLPALEAFRAWLLEAVAHERAAPAGDPA
ncbi:LysR substrate-binding domain-containing protein [Orrella sp. JC864]|uniref:LysR substrate-binding domain-containing protein n=1 Tax=Orrella sp. JC864 TaxID=3120298 RepID=UPI0012BD460E